MVDVESGGGVILATGGTGLVRAAYSSGRPAFGVGPGNVPSFLERTANIQKAVADIFVEKTFDYGTICSSEQSIVAEEGVRAQVLEESRQRGTYFLSVEEIKELGEIIFRAGSSTPNPQIVGRHATVIVEMAGIKVPLATRVLIAQLDGVGHDYPLSGEKLSPILAFYSFADLAAGIVLCKQLLHFGGLGHTISIHSQSEARVKRFGTAIPVFRVVVNSSAVHGSVGYSTNLFPTITLGCGSPRGNITSDNIAPEHLMNRKRVAWESRAVEHRTIPPEQRLVQGLPATAGASELPQQKAVASMVREAVAATTAATGSTAAIPDRQAIARIVEHVFAARGILRAAFPKAESPVPPEFPIQPSPPRVLASPALLSPSTPPTTMQFTPPPQAPASGSEKIAFAVAASPGTGQTSRRGMAVPQRSDPSFAGQVASPAPSETEKDPEAVVSAKLAELVQVVDFVSESDVRAAVSRREKIHVGPRTIVTPSARDLGNEHEIFVLVNLPPAASGKSRLE
jgi:hypothetical protein